MADELQQTASQRLQKARRRLTNGPTCYSLMLTEPPKANCAKCWNTPHSPNPTLAKAVNGLRRIIQDRGTSVLRERPSVAGDGGPTDCSRFRSDGVRLGRLAVSGRKEA